VHARLRKDDRVAVVRANLTTHFNARVATHDAARCGNEGLLIVATGADWQPLFLFTNEP